MCVWGGGSLRERVDGRGLMGEGVVVIGRGEGKDR